jgi:ribosomal protein S18 acetylase RimI-like enzyme
MADELTRRVHRNLMTVTSRMASDEAGSLRHQDGELLMASTSPLPFLNIAMREATDAPADAFVARARAFFGGHGRGFVLYDHPGDPDLGRAAEAAGLLEIMPRYPEMVCRGPLAPLPGDVRPVQSEEDAAAYWAVCDAAYPSIGMPPGVFADTFVPGDLIHEELDACLGYADGVPVACALITMAEGLGMVGWVGARPEARGRGLAAACTVWATNRGFARGGDVVSLQASVMGEPVYERLGFEHLFAYRLLGAMPG